MGPGVALVFGVCPGPSVGLTTGPGLWFGPREGTAYGLGVGFWKSQVI